MRVPLTVNDFLERAELVYGDARRHRRRARSARGVVGELTYARDRAPGARPGRRARRAGPRPRRARRDRVAQLGAAADVVLRRERLGPRPRADQLPAQRATEISYIVEHSGADGAARRPRARRRARRASTRSSGSCSARESDAGPLPLRLRARAVGTPTRTRPRRSTTRAARPRGPKGVRADAPHDLAQRDHLRLAGRRLRPRRLPAHAADVPLQRLGHAVRGHRHGRSARRAAQGRRRRDPAPGRAARRHAALRRARGRRRDPRRRGRRGTARFPAAAARASSSPARRRRPARSSGSRPSSAGSSSRSTASPRPRRCSR